MKNFQYNGKKGMAGIILVVIIMSLLALFSNSMMRMIQAEKTIQSTVDYSNRAMDAAFSGVAYAMSFAQTKKELFKNDPLVARKRIYFVKEKTDSEIAKLWPGSNLDETFANNPNVLKTRWIYLGQNLEGLYGYTSETVIDTNSNSIVEASEIDAVDKDEKEYQFRVVSYPVAQAGDDSKIDPSKFLIKSQGQYILFNDDTTIDTTDIKKFKFQIIAEVEVIFTTPKKIKLKRWKRMTYQNDTDFFKNDSY